MNESWWESHQTMRENENDLIDRNVQIMISKDDEMNWFVENENKLRNEIKI